MLLLVQLLSPILGERASAAVTSAPSISSITGYNGYVEVAFTAAGGTPSNYDYSTDGGITWTTRNPAGTWSPLTIFGLTNGTTYSIKLRGRDSSGVGTASSAVNGTPVNRSAISGGEGFLQGKYVEIGVRNNGAFGSSGTIPTGFHSNTSPCLGFRVDRQKNGWGAVVGSSPSFTNIDDGDYFCPGTQYEGWALKVGSNATDFNNHAATAIAGSVSNFVNSDTEQKVDWNATSARYGISVSQTSIVPNDGQSLYVDITLTNTTASAITDIYYLRGFDPDNGTGSTAGASTSTSYNTIVSRGGVGASAEVKSTFDSGAQVSLRSTDERARVAAGTGLSCCTPTEADPVAVWGATGSWNLALGSTTNGDNQVALSIKIPSLAAGTSTTFRVSYVLTAADANSPSATTNAATNVGASTNATLNSTVNPNGSATSVEFEYSTDSNLITGVTTVSAGTLTGTTSQSASADITGLTPGTTYYFRVKSTNSVGTSYGSILSFTPIGSPSVSSVAASSIGDTTTTLNGVISAMGGATSSIKFVYSTSSNFTSDTYTVNSTPSSATGNNSTNISAAISGLTPGVVYYYRIIATNVAGTSTSNTSNFTTTPAPTATTNAASSITSTGAVLNGSVNAKGNATSLLNFQYSTVSDLSSGVTTVTPTPNQATGSSDTPISATLTGLTTGTTYYYRVNVANINGSNSGQILSFTPVAAPTVTTNSATVNGATATLSGTVNPNGSATTSVKFVYSTNALLSADTATANAVPSVISGSTDVSVSFNLSGLAGSTTYYYRVVAVNGVGTTSGSIISFTTPTPDTTPPTVTISTTTSNFYRRDNIVVTLTFSEAVTGVSSADLTITGTSSSYYGKSSSSASSTSVYTITLTPSSAVAGTLILNVPANGAQDTSGNLNTAATQVTLQILASPAAISAPTLSATASKGSPVTITVTVDTPGKVRFLADGKVIAGCISKATTGSSPTYSATCSWKPTVMKQVTLTARVTPNTLTSSSVATSAPTSIYVIKRQTLR